MTPEEREQLRGLARWAVRFEDPAFSPGQWVPSWTGDDGVIHLGWFDPSADMSAFLREAWSNGWAYVFDWMTWAGTPEGRRLIKEPGAIDGAGAQDLFKILTTVIRGDRFSEGEIAGAFESGVLTAVARRAGVLAEE